VPRVQSLLGDLRDETKVVELILDGIRPADWSMATPADGWSIGDQVTHLAYFDEAATLAAVDEEGFRAHAGLLESHGPDFSAWVADQNRSMDPSDQYEWFRRARGCLMRAFDPLDAKARVPWYGPSMSAASCITARIMETWAHGQDIADAVMTEYPQSMRLYHVAHLGVRTRSFSFLLHELPVPDVPVTVDLEAPDGTRWLWGDTGTPDSVVGPALDFCYVVTQRRPVGATSLTVSGPAANEWLSVAQAFAGPPTLVRASPEPGRTP
jgi:uncharacterized protein (TIGR03084 family)